MANLIIQMQIIAKIIVLGALLNFKAHIIFN